MWRGARMGTQRVAGGRSAQRDEMSTTNQPRSFDTSSLPISVVDPVLRRELLDHPSHAHIVQFYEADDQLIDAVSQYLLAGLDAGEPLVIIATAEHRAAF